jgi:hypothetical protein
MYILFCINAIANVFYTVEPWHMTRHRVCDRERTIDRGMLIVVSRIGNRLMIG